MEFPTATICIHLLVALSVGIYCHTVALIPCVLQYRAVACICIDIHLSCAFAAKTLLKIYVINVFYEWVSLSKAHVVRVSKKSLFLFTCPGVTKKLERMNAFNRRP